MMAEDDFGSAVLQTAGGYREYGPPAALAGHFLCAWTNTLAPDRDGPFMVVPDGCVDIVWIDGRLTVAGPDVTAVPIRIASGTTVVGVRFRPGAAQRWLGLPMSEIVGARLALSEFWGQRAGEIAAPMGDAKTVPERMRALIEALGLMAPGHDAPSAEMGFVFNALKTESGGRGLSIILDRLEVSPRTLRRRCHEAFGYGPKTLDRILRFQRFLALSRRGAEPRLADLAFAAGYADQAHLSREVRRLSGSSAAELVARQRA